VPAGCEELTGRLPSLRPRLHVFGHIHEGHGAVVREWNVGDHIERTVFVNAANWPQGKQMTAGQAFGRGVFMPVIVDLLEEEGA
jgi:Icc-related predicted phosphoesterase